MDIPFTFGIITYADKGVNKFLSKIIKSIRNLKIPQYEIIIVGNKKKLNANYSTSDEHNDIKLIDFNEKIKSRWITKKKNLITQHAKYDNIVYQHDYIAYDNNWYEGYKKFGNKFDIVMNKIVNKNGTRYRDWVLYPYHNSRYRLCKNRGTQKLWDYAGIKNNKSMLPYNESRFIKWQYISGAYWVAKKLVMEEFPLDESLVWGKGEDCCWSVQVMEKYKFSMNVYSKVYLLRQHTDPFSPMLPECYEKLEEYWENFLKGKND